VVKVEVIRKRLDKLGEYLDFLERVRGYSLEDFLSDPEHYGSTERFLQLAIESVNDMASHIVAEEGWGSVNASRDLPMLFYRQSHIDEALERRWERMIGFRNILVHDYLEVNRKLVYEVLQHDLADLRQLEKMFARFL
jgi:uncharacterized protein YutE (UPF0331/DUF86 family)